MPRAQLACIVVTACIPVPLLSCTSLVPRSPEVSPIRTLATAPVAVESQTELVDHIREVRRARESGLPGDRALEAIRKTCDTEEEWSTVVRGLDVLHTRPTWPAEHPVQMWIRGCPWVQGYWRVTAVPTDMFMPVLSATAPLGWCGWGIQADLESHRKLEVGYVAPDRDELEFDVVIHTSPGGLGSPSNIAWTGRIRLPLRFVPSLDEVIPVVRMPQLDEEVQNAIFVYCPGPGRPLQIEVWAKNPDRTNGVSLRIEVRRGDVVVQSVTVPCRIRGESWSEWESASRTCRYVPAI